MHSAPFIQLFFTMMQASAKLEQALECKKCKVKTGHVEEHEGCGFFPGEVWLISCPRSFCNERPWFFCKTCKSRSYQNSLAKHAASKKHQRNSNNSNSAYAKQAQQEHPSTPVIDGNSTTPPTPKDNGNTVIVEDVEMQEAVQESQDVEQEIQIQHHSAVDPSPPSAAVCYFPKLKMDGNEWLNKLLIGTKKATRNDVMAAFAKPQLEHLKIFYVSELASGEDKCGGGLMYLVAKAFAQAKDSQLDDEEYPDYIEAKWQVNYMIQYQSMNEKQRLRQSHIDQALVSFLKKKDMFDVTNLPPYNLLGRYYGSSAQHSIYNGLPVPCAVDVGGVAYVSPLAIIAFVMGMGIPIDDVFVTADSSPVNTGTKRVNNVDQCLKASEWYREIQKNYYGSESPPGAPSKYPAVVCIHLSDWSDGFDAAKVKANRSGIQSKTFTVSPPKHATNGTDNTFAVALGLKKAAGWKKVEELFRTEVEELTRSREPILLYHGVLQKMVPCFFKRFAVLSDKMERNVLTGTIGCGSNLHKCFGISGNIQTPSCRCDELDEFFLHQISGANKPAGYGWSERFIVHEGKNANKPGKNGAIFPSCKDCRMDILVKLLGLNGNDVLEQDTLCQKCHKWDLISPPHIDKVLTFPAHSDYPKSIKAGSPVPPPQGRHLFGKEVHLPFIRMSWEFMIQACKFAYYQVIQKAWTKGNTVAYLKHCGIAIKLGDQLFEDAKLARGQPVNYNSSVKIGNFHFDPGWLSKDMAMQDYIEGIMHLLFLGAAESNYELIMLWLSKLPKGGPKISATGFKRALQELIKDLRGFGLSWLMAYPLTGQKGKLGTGSWVAENWVFLVRVSQLIFGWCSQDKENASKYGADDVSRMVIAFHAFVARCLTHSGIDERGIAEAELYLKEFLSSLREFDVRVRSKKLNKPTKKVSEQKKTEAWWLKPNYMSLRNLIYILRVLGPLVLWWDGGGRGERFIQLVKPHIKKGVRGDALNFFVSLLGKLFRERVIGIFDKRYELDTTIAEEAILEEANLVEILEDIAQTLGTYLETVEEEEESEEEEEEEEDDSEEEETEEEEEEEGLEQEEYKPPMFSTSEIHGMTKAKAFYIYRNQGQLNECLMGGKPISGIVAVEQLADGKTAFEFQVVFRKPVKQLARRKVVFNDKQGVYFNGLWCAPLTVEDEDEMELPPLNDTKELQGIAKISAVAIPLRYILGQGHKDSNKFCVITNWWKYRSNRGTYELPTLDSKLYGSVGAKFNIDQMFKKAAKEAAKAPRKGKEVVQRGVI